MLYQTPADFTAALPASGRLLGLDLGSTTIGLALSDASRMIATPHFTIERKNFAKDMAALKEVIQSQQVAGLVIGHPINMDGSLGPRSQSTKSFVSNLAKQTDLPLLLWDERLSTMAVNRMMEEEADMSRQRRAELVDKLAASYMLQGCLDSLRQS